MERPRIGGTSCHPALLANYLGSKLERQTGEGCARFAMVSAIYAVVLPDGCIHLGRRLAPGHSQVVMGDVDDG